MTSKQPVYEIEESARRVCDLPASLRPREEIERAGVENVSHAVLLAVILRSGVARMNVVDLAQGLLQRYRSLAALGAAPAAELAEVRGIGKVKAQILKAALELGRRLGQEALPPRVQVRTPEDVERVLGQEAQKAEREVFWALHLDAKNRLKGRPCDVSRGLVDASPVHPREVFREAIRTATSAVVLAHNHPSGDPTPSAEDVRVTRQLVEAGRILDIRVLDHVVLGKREQGRSRGYLSMREEGIVNFGG
jgi:DNA repair protein RadC